MDNNDKPQNKLTVLPKTANPSPELSKKIWLATWIDKTQRRFEQELTDIRARDTLEDWSQLYDRIGPIPFERVLREGFLTWKFFPKPSDILEMREQLIETIARERQAEVAEYRRLHAPPEETLSEAEKKALWEKVKNAAKQKAMP